jgi:hypothetical protein
MAGSFSYVVTVAQTNTILGFSASSAQAQLETEKKYDANLQAKNVDALIKRCLLYHTM